MGWPNADVSKNKEKKGGVLAIKEQNFCQIKKELRSSFSRTETYQQPVLHFRWGFLIGMGNGQFFIQFEGGDMGIKERNFCQIKK